MLASSGGKLEWRDGVGLWGGKTEDGSVKGGGEVGPGVRFEEEEVIVEVGEGGRKVRDGVEVGLDGEAAGSESGTRRQKRAQKREAEKRRGTAHEL